MSKTEVEQSFNDEELSAIMKEIEQLEGEFTSVEAQAA